MARQPKTFQGVEIPQINATTQEMSRRMGELIDRAFAGGNNLKALDGPEKKESTSQEQRGIANQLASWNVSDGGQLSDREILARTLRAEAGNQGANGMMAVGEVIANRVKNGRWGDTLGDVILAPGQFSAWNSVTGYANGEQGQDMLNMRPRDIDYQIADSVIGGRYKPQTNGALNYYANYVNPAWGRQAGGNWNLIGDHWFGTAR